jgi:DNA-binding NarL/FixJ family response regulator
MIKVFIADDHAVVREGLKQICRETADLVVAGEAVNGLEALDRIRGEEWDVAVIDMTMPGRSGLEIVKELKRDRPQLPILVLSVHSEDQYAIRLLKAGAAGYLTKQSVPDELVDAIRRVVSGGKYVSPSLAEKLALQLDRDFANPPHEVLSDREFQVLRLIASGRTVSEIATELSLSVKTVSTYRSRILEKMNLNSNAELIRYAIENGLIE